MTTSYEPDLTRTHDPAGLVHLHARSWYSFLRGASSPEALVARAAELGQPAVAVTDFMSVSGAVKLQSTAGKAGINPIVGTELMVDEHPLVLLAASNEGYATICRLLTLAFAGRQDAEERDDARVPLSALADDNAGLFLLTGGREGKLRTLLERHEDHAALEWARELGRLLPGRAFVELGIHRRPGEARVLNRLGTLARAAGLPAVASNDVRHATADEWLIHDLLSCVRLGITVHDRHSERPVNDEAHLKDESEMRRLVFDPAARANTLALASECRLDLLPGHITPPGAIVPHGRTPQQHLRDLCDAGLGERYRQRDEAPARAQLERELGVIEGLDLSDFFLVVHEVVHFARQHGIRCAGRGSAANSIVAYVLGITAVDPIEHHLLFERFLHAGRKGTPDIDVDFDTSRRDEVIEWMEGRFGSDHTAMTANVNTYQARSAVRDVAKALGWPLPVVDEMSRVLNYHGRCARIAEQKDALMGVVGPSPLLDVLIKVVERLDGCPRHLSLHSGGMLLTRGELWRHTPIRVSANGVKQAVFDKEDVEMMGLVKLDVLGLRSLAAVSAAVELHENATGETLPVDSLDLGDPNVYDMICEGETLALFQVESPGQMALIARHQPRNFQELVAEIALLRPGPLQGGVVHPFVRRARGLEPVTYPHPCLDEVLRDTFGIILYQEQVLEVAHKFAGLSLEESDEFRRLMSKWRDPGEMSGMRDRFVSGALRAHPDLDQATAEEVFFQVSQFVGYGFPRSHAAAFARTVYQTAWLKRYHPAAYMAAVMEHHPGMYPRQSLLQEARRHGVTVLGPSLLNSGKRYGLERYRDRLAIRMPLTSVNGVAPEDADALLLERAASPFRDADDLYRRARVSRDVLWALGEAGALECFGRRRDVLWQLGVLERKLGAPGLEAPPLLDAPSSEAAELASLADLSSEEAAAWDVRAAGASAGPHPVAIRRASLNLCGVTPIERVTHDREFTVAGHVIARQRPGTAKGIVFITLEDETGRLQCIAYPQVWDALKGVLKQNALVVTGRVQRERQWRGLTIRDARHLSLVGGVAGSPHG